MLMDLAMTHLVALSDDESVGIANRQLFERPFRISSIDLRSNSRVQLSIAQSTGSVLESKVTTLKGFIRPNIKDDGNRRRLLRLIELDIDVDLCFELPYCTLYVLYICITT